MSYFVASATKRRVPVMLPGRELPVDEKVEPGPPAHAVLQRMSAAACGIDAATLLHFPNVAFEDVVPSDQCRDCFTRVLVLRALQRELRRRPPK